MSRSYNVFFGKNSINEILLKILNLNESQIPRYRDCFIYDDKICIHTRTGGDNREFYTKKEFSKEGDGPFNDDLCNHPLYITDEDDNFDSTYANFYFQFPEEFKEELQLMGKEKYLPSEKWKKIFGANND